METRSGQWSRAALALPVTLAAIHFVPERRLVAVFLPIMWAGLFYPLDRADLILFALASVFFLVQNYVSLSAGLFEFAHKDILLMPYYEPFLWGFYFLTLKRIVADRRAADVRLNARTFVAVAITSAMFSLAGGNSQLLFKATLASMALLFALFHEREDFLYAGAALVLGFIVELFGVSTGLWRYPDPDFLGIPLWFATMWGSVGLLLRRFAIPMSEWLAPAQSDHRP